MLNLDLVQILDVVLALEIVEKEAQDFAVIQLCLAGMALSLMPEQIALQDTITLRLDHFFR